MHEECVGWVTWDQRIMRLEAQRVGTAMHDLHRPETTADKPVQALASLAGLAVGLRRDLLESLKVFCS